MPNPLIPQIAPRDFNSLSSKVKKFFTSLNYTEVYTQSRLEILSACEDPKTVSTFNYLGQVWPLPQTNQMSLEQVLLEDPTLDGLYCYGTSYRQEPNPIHGRHSVIFGMLEFELPGELNKLRVLEEDFLHFLGFPTPKHINYEDACKEYGVTELTAEHELQLQKDLGDVVFLEKFPEHTSPFYNMKRDEDNPLLANKIDVILCGIETIGSAERSTDVKQMRETFHTISNGEYAKLLYDKFGVDRVEKELEAFLSLSFFPRSGGGIGLTRLIRAMKAHDLL